MKKTYALLRPDIEGEVIYTFCDGYLFGFEIRSDSITVPFVRGILAKLPLTLNELKDVSVNPLARITEILPDLTFGLFWEKYAYKVGNKARAERLWMALPDAQKQAALSFLPKYEQQLLQTRIGKLYPETYLHQKRFLNK